MTKRIQTSHRKLNSEQQEQQSVDRHVAALGHIILIPSKLAFISSP